MAGCSRCSRSSAASSPQLTGLSSTPASTGVSPPPSAISASTRQTLETNLVAALAQAKAAVEIFRDQRAGHLAIVSSLTPVRGMPGNLNVYSASKSGVSALAYCICAYLHGSSIKVTALLPGYIESEINDEHGNTAPPYITKGCEGGWEGAFQGRRIGDGEPKLAVLPGGADELCDACPADRLAERSSSERKVRRAGWSRRMTVMVIIHDGFITKPAQDRSHRTGARSTTTRCSRPAVSRSAFTRRSRRGRPSWSSGRGRGPDHEQPPGPRAEAMVRGDETSPEMLAHVRGA